MKPLTRKEFIVNGADVAPVTREEATLKKLAAGGGGGGGLPAYTTADAGKILTVGEDAEHPATAYVISQQTVTLDGEGAPAVLPEGSYDFNGVSGGDTLTLTINGTDYTITAASGYGYDFIFNGEITGTDSVQLAYGSGQGCGFNYLRRSGDVSSQLAGDYEISLTKSVPSAAPVWANMISVFPVNAEVYAKMATVMQTAIPAAIAAGLGVPYYVPVIMGAMVDTEGWDSYTELLKQTVANKGVFAIDNDGSLHYPIFASYKESESDSIKKVGQVHFLMTYVVNDYMVDVHMIMVTNMNVETKQFGIGGWLTLVDAPSNP